MAGPTQSSGLRRLVQLLMGQEAQQQPQAANPFSVPFTGLRNTPQALPPFQAPGEEFAKYQNVANPLPAVPPVQPNIPQPGAEVPVAAPMSPSMVTNAPLPQTPPVVPPMPEPIPVGAGTREDVMKAFQDMQKRNLLPEQWKGSFSNIYGWPE